VDTTLARARRLDDLAGLPRRRSDAPAVLPPAGRAAVRGSNEPKRTWGVLPSGATPHGARAAAAPSIDGLPPRKRVPPGSPEGRVSSRGVARIAVVILPARLLTPSDFGVAGMALILSTLVLVFADVGLGAASSSEGVSPRRSVTMF
jgi:hypothetical protein